MPANALLRNILVVFSLLVLPVSNLEAEPPTDILTVVTPQVPPPFDKVFGEILAGIQREAPGKVDSIEISRDTTSADIQASLKSTTGTSVIALGNQAKKLLKPLGGKYHIVYGAVFLNPGEEPKAMRGISLTPSPQATFRWLKDLAPNIKTVHVVYQHDYSGWLIALADQAAPHYGLTLAKHAVDNVREAAVAFRNILDSEDPKSNAIWLMQRDPSLDERAVVPDILAQAWNKDFVVFSSNPAHVPRGALFALYPDNEKMGSSLAKLALTPDGHGIVPLSDLLIAVNVRTASHVGRNFTRREEKQFNLIFPNR